MGLKTVNSPGAGWLRERTLSIPKIIDDTCVDARSTGETHKLLGGLVLGVITASGKLANYSAANSDGTQNAKYILMHPVDMKDGDASASSVDHASDVLKIGSVLESELGGIDSGAITDLTMIEVLAN